MEADRTRPLDWDPLGDATRERAEIKMTGAQLMDLIEERDAAIADAAATRSALRQLLDECLNNEHTIQHYATGVEMARYYRVSPEAFIEARRVLVSDVPTQETK